MNTVRVTAPAKVNLTLEITGAEGGFHMLDSVVATVDLADEITVKLRGDGAVNIDMSGMGGELVPYNSNNAVRAARLFMQKFGCGGCDISVKKNIPMGAGLGGSSADAAGVLRALCKLCGVPVFEAAPIADEVGSDTRYMLRGGYARLFGRGNEVVPIESDLELDLLIIVPRVQVSTAQCYARYDDFHAEYFKRSEAAAEAISRGDKAALCNNLFNALYAPACTLCGGVEEAFRAAMSLSPMGAAMTGSGSAVFAVFENAALCRKAYSRCAGDFSVFRTKTIKSI